MFLAGFGLLFDVHQLQLLQLVVFLLPLINLLRRANSMCHRGKRRRRSRNNRRRQRCFPHEDSNVGVTPCNDSVRGHPPRHAPMIHRREIRLVFRRGRGGTNGVRNNRRRNSMQNGRSKHLTTQRPTRRSNRHVPSPRRESGTRRVASFKQRDSIVRVGSVWVECECRRRGGVTNRMSSFFFQRRGLRRRVRRRGRACPRLGLRVEALVRRESIVGDVCQSASGRGGKRRRSRCVRSPMGPPTKVSR